MREIKNHRNIIIILLFSVLVFFSGCDAINFGGDINKQLEKELGVTYSFYEYPDVTSSHIDKVFIVGKTLDESSFPSFVHDDTLLVGWKYFKNSTSGSTEIPSNFFLNERSYIQSFEVAYEPESLYAVWKNKCTVTFVTNCDYVVKPVIVAESYYISVPEMNSIWGKFRFAGWYKDPDFRDPFYFDEPVMSDMTLYAQWVEFFTVTYVKNNGTGEIFTEDYPIGSAVNIKDWISGPRADYGFVGWSTSNGGTVEYYSGDTIYGVSSDLTLYAVWTKDIVTITYIDTNGKFKTRKSQYGRGAHVLLGQVPNESGYWYENLESVWLPEGKELAGYSPSPSQNLDNLEYGSWGWHQLKDENGNPILNENGDPIYSNFTTVTTDLTFYVYFRPVVFTVTFRYFDQNGLEYSLGNDVDVKWNEKLSPPADEPYVPGYEFEGWYLAENIGDHYLMAEEAFDFETPFTDEVFKGQRYIYLVAKFKENGINTGYITASVSLEESQESDIYLSLALINRETNSITLNVAPGYLEYHWLLNGVEQAEFDGKDEITIDTSSWNQGKYDLTLIVYDGSEYYSWYGIITRY